MPGTLSRPTATPGPGSSRRRVAPVRAVLVALVCLALGLTSGGRAPSVVTLADRSDAAVVYRPAPDDTAPSLAGAAPLDAASVSGRIALGVRGVATGPVRFDLRGPSPTAGSGTLIAREATTVVVLDTAPLDAGTWTITATPAGQGHGPAASATFTVHGQGGSAVGPPPAGGPEPSPKEQAPPEHPSTRSPSAPRPSTAQPAITRSGSTIMRGGRPWWFLGYDSFVWSGDCGEGTEKMNPQQVEAWFASMRHDGHGAVRLFFYRGWNQQALDRALASARRNNVYVTITLDDAIGGCGASKKDASWFSDRTSTTDYRQHLTELVARYRGDPTIAWFEYFNEPGAVGGALRGFYDTMGAAAKKIDPTRLFSSGTLSPDSTGGAAGYRRISASPGVDIASLHEYDETEAESNHGPEARQNSAGKPVIVGEAGIKAGTGCGVSDGQRAARFRAKATAYTATPGYAGMLAWSWGRSGGCEYENLDADSATQTVLRTAGPPSGEAG